MPQTKQAKKRLTHLNGCFLLLDVTKLIHNCIFFVLALAQYFQVGLVSGGISTKCGDKNIPSYFTRLDHPEIASFIANPSGKGKINVGTILYLLRPEKSTLRFFLIKSTSMMGNGTALVFHYYLRKFSLNIFPDLKSKKIKNKKFAHFFVILTKITFV